MCSYTPHNRLKDATETATLKARYTYNGLGQRIGKTNATTGTGQYVLYGSNGERLVETDEQGNVLLEYLYLNGQLLAVYAPDDDQDGIPNQQEAQQSTLPTNTDNDGDGLTNLTEWYQYGTDSANPDSDGDGIDDGVEIAQGTDPTQSSSFAGDGDINADSTVNLGDLVLMHQFVTGSRTPTQNEFARADMNQDGEINTADLLLLQQKILQVMLGMPILAHTEQPVRPTQQMLTQASSAPGILDWLISPAQALPNNGGVLYYVHNDPLGTPQALTDEAGTTVWTAVYDPFGQAAVNEDPDNDGNSVEFNVRFPGQYYDQETGLHYNYFRYYDPATGRYLTSDPIGLIAGPNPYTYVSNNPLSFVDPYGLFELPSLPQGVVDTAAGFGDGISFGLTGLIRGALDIDGGVNECSAAFKGSKFSGNFVLPSAGTLRGLAFLGGTRRGSQILNRNPFVRIGSGRMPGNGSLPAGPKVPRLSIGKGPGNPHVDLRVRPFD